MEKIENEKNGLMQSQKLLYEKFKRINKLFLIHFSSLFVYFLFALGYIIIWIYLLINGEFTPNLIQLYGSFGIPWTIMLSIGTLLIVILIGSQIYIYSVFLIKGNHYLKQVKGKEKTRATLYRGIVPYINNFFSFFNRFSKKKTNLVMLVRTFLFANFISGWLAIFFITRLIDQITETAVLNSILVIFMTIIFLISLIFWFISLITSFKVGKEVTRWEKLFPKLEDWAHELENISIENLNHKDSLN